MKKGKATGLEREQEDVVGQLRGGSLPGLVQMHFVAYFIVAGNN